MDQTEAERVAEAAEMIDRDDEDRETPARLGVARLTAEELERGDLLKEAIWLLLKEKMAEDVPEDRTIAAEYFHLQRMQWANACTAAALDLHNAVSLELALCSAHPLRKG